MIAARCKISESKHIADIDIEKMRHIIETMTHFGFVITGDKGFDYGQVCQGGVALDDIDISNMECKKVKGVLLLVRLLMLTANAVAITCNGRGVRHT